MLLYSIKLDPSSRVCVVSGNNNNSTVSWLWYHTYIRVSGNNNTLVQWSFFIGNTVDVGKKIYPDFFYSDVRGRDGTYMWPSVYV